MRFGANGDGVGEAEIRCSRGGHVRDAEVVVWQAGWQSVVQMDGCERGVRGHSSAQARPKKFSRGSPARQYRHSLWL